MRSPPLHLRPGDRRWPTELDDIDGPPSELWARGRIELLRERPRVAIVGTRSPTAYGEAQAGRFARWFGAHGVVVVSGLARGVDQTAHRGALEAAGGTIAVLGSGVDRPWPEGELAQRIGAEGLLLSEYAPEQAPRRHHFPLRNRLISALADAVLVVEAGYRSGSLITSRWAADQGRPVFALPGRVDHPMARGCHRLIGEGATLVESPEQLAEEMDWSPPPTGDVAGARSTARPSGKTLRDDPLLAALRGETLSADELRTRLDWPMERVLVALVEAELAGHVVRGPGGLFRLG